MSLKCLQFVQDCEKWQKYTLYNLIYTSVKLSLEEGHIFLVIFNMEEESPNLKEFQNESYGWELSDVVNV